MKTRIQIVPVMEGSKRGGGFVKKHSFLFVLLLVLCVAFSALGENAPANGLAMEREVFYQLRVGC